MKISPSYLLDNNENYDLRSRLLKKYLLPGQDESSLFFNVASYYASNDKHRDRLYQYMMNREFIPATPVLIRGNKKVGLPISCFVNEYEDSMESIRHIWSENVSIGAEGGGIGSYIGCVRSIGEPIAKGGTTSGIIPFLKVMDSITMAINQGSHRRGAAAAYINIDHPEILSFIDMRKPSGDINRRTNHIHHGIAISDKFMQAVENMSQWHLRSPLTGEIIKTVNAIDLWIRILDTRIETGEPYLLFIDNVNKNINIEHKEKGLFVKTSNLCSEITLFTGKDYQDKIRTGVCCLSSINIAKVKDLRQITRDVLLFLDNVLQDFIDNATDEFKNAKYSAYMERSVGLGVMGFHTYLQQNMIDIESDKAREINIEIFSKIKKYSDEYSIELAKERGSCPDSINDRFINKIAIAPNASTAIINECSPGIDLIPSNAYTHKSSVGSAMVINPILKELLQKKGLDNKNTWNNIIMNNGSVQNINGLTEQEKAIFKTPFEIDQRSIVKLAADRTKYICQSQSLNIYTRPNIHKKDLHEIHMLAWKLGVKSMYYHRTQSMQRPECTACAS